MNHISLRQAIRYALFANVAATAGVTVANAANSSTSSTDQAALEEVVVTGSRIVAPGLESISPVTTINAEDIKLQGVTRVEDLLNQLPQVFSDQGGSV